MHRTRQPDFDLTFEKIYWLIQAGIAMSLRPVGTVLWSPEVDPSTSNEASCQSAEDEAQDPEIPECVYLRRILPLMKFSWANKNKSVEQVLSPAVEASAFHVSVLAFSSYSSASWLQFLTSAETWPQQQWLKSVGSKGPSAWDSRPSHLLWGPMECHLEFWLFHLWSSSLKMHLGKQQEA